MQVPQRISVTTLDFIPTSLIKSSSGVFAQAINYRLANLSFEHSTFPIQVQDYTGYTPLLKKHGLAVSDPTNYRPIRNLNTISKILERWH